MASTALDLNSVQQQATGNSLASIGSVNSYINDLFAVQQANNALAYKMAIQQQNWSAEQAELTRRFNAAEAAKSRNWQEMMSNTAHQREVKDLIAAGLNPILSATGGNGAYVGSGASAAATNPSGAAASPDTSISNAIVSLLGNMLSATTRLAEMSTSALTNEAVADKYTAAQMAAASLSAGATRYSADAHSAASRYSSDVSKYIADTYQSNPWQVVSGLISGLSEGDTSTGSGISRTVGKLLSKLTGGKTDSSVDVIAGADRRR